MKLGPTQVALQQFENNFPHAQTSVIVVSEHQPRHQNQKIAYLVHHYSHGDGSEHPWRASTFSPANPPHNLRLGPKPSTAPYPTRAPNRTQSRAPASMDQSAHPQCLSSRLFTAPAPHGHRHAAATSVHSPRRANRALASSKGTGEQRTGRGEG